MDRQDPSAQLKRVVICNASEKVCAVVEQLLQCGMDRHFCVSLIVQDEELWRDNPSWHPREGCPLEVVMGCPTDAESLRRAGIEDAYAAVILADPRQGIFADARSTLVGIAIERINPHVHTVMELKLSVNRSHLRATDVDEVICLGEVAEKVIGMSCINPGISHLFTQMLTAEDTSRQLFLPRLPEALGDRSYRELARLAIRRAAPCIFCGYIAGGTRRSAIVLNPRADTDPGKDTVLPAGTQLIVLARTEPDLHDLWTAE